MKTTTVMMALLVLSAAVSMAPTASAFRCPEPTTFDNIQECEQAVEEAAQGVVILVLERACDFFGC